MENPGDTQAATAAVREVVTDAQALAREQVSAAWQLQVDRVRELLDAGWREHLDHVLCERFADVRSRLDERFGGAVEAAARQLTEAGIEAGIGAARRGAHRELTDRLNQTARRMKQAETRDVWIQALLERAADFCGRAALFAIRGKSLRYEGSLGVEDESAGPVAEIPLESAPAFANAVESKDTVVALATASQLSEPVTELFGEYAGRRIYLFPFAYRGAIVGVLYAEPGDEPIDVNGLELLTALAETTIESETPVFRGPEGLIRIAGGDEQKTAGLQWNAMPRAAQERHSRAERFARNRVAQIMLYKIHLVRTGRDSHDLYAALKEDIDAGREAFREQFLQAAPGMPDYFHAELVRTLAKDDAGLLGAAYPGPLA